MKIARDGFGIIGVLVVCNSLLTIAYLSRPLTWHPFLLIFGWLLTALVIFFFRDPQRTIPTGTNIVIAPADGRIVQITETYEQHHFKSRVQQISIFLSLYDVHINRIPISGTIVYFDHLNGKFRPAFTKRASLENEHTIIAIEDNGRRVVFKQIAGIIARRIVCHVTAGSKVTAGQKFGMIRFGSRIDLFLPPDVELNVHENDKIIGGETIIGRFTCST